MVKVVIFSPTDSADEVRRAIGEAGGGKIGNYDHCSFSTRGVGRFRALESSNPAIGEAGEITKVEEERIEFVCERDKLQKVIDAVKKAHPYEEVPIDVYAIELI